MAPSSDSMYSCTTGGTVWTEVEAWQALLELLARAQAHDARARAADIGLDHQGKADAIEDLEHLVAMVYDDGARVAHAQTLEEAELERLGLLEPVGRHGVDHRHAQ